MKIVRQRSPVRYTVIDNNVIEDPRLSFRARGLLIFLLSRPDGWSTDARRLAALTREGRDAIRVTLNELEAAGYLTRRKHRNTLGVWVAEWVVRDQPAPASSDDETAGRSQDGFSDMDSTVTKPQVAARTGNPAAGKPGAINKYGEQVHRYSASH